MNMLDQEDYDQLISLGRVLMDNTGGCRMLDLTSMARWRDFFPNVD